MSVDLDLVIVFGTIVATALVARFTRLPITALEIVAGLCLVGLLGFAFPDDLNALVVLGSLLIVFLAGFETNLAFLRGNLGRALTVGLPGFLVPFAGLFAVLYYGLHAPLLVAIIGATALADTSISITYTTLRQYDLTDLPFGRLVLASTLAVNLAEDFSITTTSFLTTPGIVFTLAVLGALLVAAFCLPQLTRALAKRGSDGFSNVTTRSLLFSLAVLATLSAMVGVPGILFVFLMGLIFSQYADRLFVRDLQKVAFAIFVPFYFVAVGLRVDLGFVAANLPLVLALAAGATALKLAAIYPTARHVFGPQRAAPVATLMNARLTSATVILLLTLTLGLIPLEWYSVLISVVVVLALGSALAVRAFPAFRSTSAAQAAFAGEFATGVEETGRSARPTIAAPTVRSNPPRA